MKLDEISLRQLMNSPHGPASAIAILDSVARGKPLVVIRPGGEATVLESREEVSGFLRNIGWQPPDSGGAPIEQ